MLFAPALSFSTMQEGQSESEKELAKMTDFAINSLEDNDYSNLRQTYEEILKVAAMHLTEKTQKEQLIKLLRICAFIG